MSSDIKYKFIKTSKDNHVFYLTLARPEKRNAFTRLMVSEIHHALQYANTDSEIRVVVLKAEGSVFCAGMDLKDFENPEISDFNSGIPMIDYSLGEVISMLNKPSVAVLEGNVIAGGFLLILECTYVFANSSVQFSLPEVQIGLFPFQVLAGLLKHLPYHKALDLCIRGDIFSAQEMKNLGLVYEITDQNPDRFEILLGKLVSAAPLAVKMGFEAAKQLNKLNADEQYPYLINQLNTLRSSKDFKEGMAARLDKRQANWSGE